MMEILIRDTPEAVATTAADIMTGYIREGATLGVATGSTPLATYRELIRRHQEEDLSFADTQLFALDEYVGLGADHPQSYRRVLEESFTSHIDVPASSVHVPDGTAENLLRASADYERDVEAAGGVDLQLLGVGTNGHVGFNEPGSSLTSLTRVKILHPQTIRDNARFFDSEDEVPRLVLTQGLGTLLRARHLMLLATGDAKAEAIANLVEGPFTANCPGSILQWHRHATVIVDSAAAAKLHDVEYYRFVEANKPEWQRY